MPYTMFFLLINSIGIIPVALAMGSFLFLIFLLSFHTLRNSYQTLNASVGAMIEESRNYYQVFKKLVDLVQTKGDYINHSERILSVGSSLMSEDINLEKSLRANKNLQNEIKIVKEIVFSIPILNEDSSIISAVEELSQKEQTYQIAYKKYAYNLKYYNNFVAKMPSKLVANMLGYRLVQF